VALIAVQSTRGSRNGDQQHGEDEQMKKDEVLAQLVGLDDSMLQLVAKISAE